MKKTLPSGNVLEIRTLSMLKAYGIGQEAMNVISEMEIDLGETKLSRDEIKKIFATDIMKFSQTFIRLFADKRLVGLAHQCFERCTYNGLKLTPYDDKSQDEVIEETFGENFGDYPIAMAHVLFENIKPFIKSLGSLLPKKSKKKPTDLGQKLK